MHSVHSHTTLPLNFILLIAQWNLIWGELLNKSRGIYQCATGCFGHEGLLQLYWSVTEGWGAFEYSSWWCHDRRWETTHLSVTLKSNSWSRPPWSNILLHISILCVSSAVSPSSNCHAVVMSLYNTNSTLHVNGSLVAAWEYMRRCVPGDPWCNGLRRCNSPNKN